ncbi:MAG: hypothetical protein Q8Q29_02040 [Actinomycetota bacterium]|nr:hypothetical protein [Actinomycetota bacterium]
MTPVTDLRDSRVLIPRVRRTLEGPLGTGSANAAASDLTDDQVNAIIADSVANVILYTGGLFGHQLQVEARDDVYQSPIAWLVDPALTEDEASVIVAQAALDYFFNDLKALKVGETIRDEAVEWTYQLSANALLEYLKNLRKLRDDAIERIMDSEAPADGWVNFLAVRDGTTTALIEPWASPGGAGGQEFVTGGF